MILDKEFTGDLRVEKEVVALRNAGFDVFVLCLNYGSKPECEDFHGAKIIRISKSKSIIKKLRALTNTIFNFYPHWWAKHIVEFVKKYQIDVLHIHDLYMLGAGFIAKKNLHSNIKIIGDLHENYADAIKYYKFSTTFPGNILISKKKWAKIEEKWIGELYYAIAVAEEMKNRICPYINKEKIIVIGNYPDLYESLSYGKDESLIEKYRGHFVISYIGGFDYHRGIGTLIEATQYLSEISDLKICIVGHGSNINELKRKANELKVNSKIIFEGWQTPKKLLNYFKISDVGIIPHLKSIQTDNSSPNKLFHYMLMERPIVATNCNSIQRIIEETKCGLIYENKNSHQLAEAVIKLYKSESLRQQMGANGKKAVMEKYNWEKTSRNLIKLYEKIENSINNRE